MGHPIWPCHLTRGQKQPQCYKFVWRETEASSLQPWDWASAIFWIWNVPQRSMCKCKGLSVNGSAVRWSQSSLFIMYSPIMHCVTTCPKQWDWNLPNWGLPMYMYIYIYICISKSYAYLSFSGWLSQVFGHSHRELTYWILNFSHVFNVRIAAGVWAGSCGREEGKEEKGQRELELRTRQKHCFLWESVTWEWDQTRSTAWSRASVF
jgi:hypothetical protein